MPTTPHWQLQTPINAVIFDCDGTLSAIEGIDELAATNEVGHAVQAMTAEAMGGSGLNPTLYHERLQLVHPKQEQIHWLGHHYKAHQVAEADVVIDILQRLHKSVYIVSAGLKPAVVIFGELLKVPREHIFAVDIHFDAQGNYINFDADSPLIHNDGKRQTVVQLIAKNKEVAYVGDGVNDLSACALVKRFIGYGGVFYRENIAAACDYYINTRSFAAILPLLLTQQEADQLAPADKLIYQHGIELIANDFVLMN